MRRNPRCTGTAERACFAVPVVAYTAVLLGWYVFSHVIEKAVHGRWKIGMIFKNRYLYLGAAIILANWIVKNLLLILADIRL